MKIPIIFPFKCPSLERIVYHLLRLFGILIGIAAIFYIMYDGKIHDTGSKRKVQERLIRRKIVVLITYSCWIIGIIWEKVILMWFVLYILTIAVAYCVFVILSILLPIFIQWIHHREVPNEAYQSLKKYSLVLVFFVLMFPLHYYIYKKVDKGKQTSEKQNEETTLLNKQTNGTVNGGNRCGFKFPCCV